MLSILARFTAPIGALLGLVLAFNFVRLTTMSLWLAVPVGIVIIYATVLVVGFAIGKARG